MNETEVINIVQTEISKHSSVCEYRFKRMDEIHIDLKAAAARQDQYRHDFETQITELVKKYLDSYDVILNAYELRFISLTGATEKTGEKLDVTNKRLDKLLWWLIGVLLSIVGALGTFVAWIITG